MPEYTVTPTTEPTWRLDPNQFMASIQARWPGTRTEVDASDAPMAAHALIPLDNQYGELGVALDQQKWAVILDPADPSSAAEFIDWYRTQIPSYDPEVFVITEDFETSLPLTEGTTRSELENFLLAAT